MVYPPIHCVWGWCCMHAPSYVDKFQCPGLMRRGLPSECLGLTVDDVWMPLAHLVFLRLLFQANTAVIPPSWWSGYIAVSNMLQVDSCIPLSSCSHDMWGAVLWFLLSLWHFDTVWICMHSLYSGPYIMVPVYMCGWNRQPSWPKVSNTNTVEPLYKGHSKLWTPL